MLKNHKMFLFFSFSEKYFATKKTKKKKKNFEVLYLWLHNWKKIHKFDDIFFPSILAIQNLQNHFSFGDEIEIEIEILFRVLAKKKAVAIYPPSYLRHCCRRLSPVPCFLRYCFCTPAPPPPPPAARSVHASPEEACSISDGDGAFPRSTPHPR
jgi:hypothetical protein